MSQLNSSLDSLDGFLLSGTLDVTGLAASADSVAAAAVPPQPTTSSTLSALAAAEVRNPAQGCGLGCNAAELARAPSRAPGARHLRLVRPVSAGHGRIAEAGLLARVTSPWQRSQGRPGRARSAAQGRRPHAATTQQRQAKVTRMRASTPASAALLGSAQACLT